MDFRWQNRQLHDATEKRQKTDANELWLYFREVIEWVEATFPHYRKE